MEETIDRPGFFGRVTSWFVSPRDEEHDEYDVVAPVPLKLQSAYRYNVTVRRQVVSFQDAVAAADGLKRGEQQVLNLSMATSEVREKIKNFMCGINYAADGSWEELGDNVFLLAPSTASVEVAPAAQRLNAEHA